MSRFEQTPVTTIIIDALRDASKVLRRAINELPAGEEKQPNIKARLDWLSNRAEKFEKLEKLIVDNSHDVRLVSREDL